ncbi:MAG: TRAP transporter small permease [Eubacteriales bacterium]
MNIVKKLDGFMDRLCKALFYICALLLFILLAVCFANVVSRLLKAPLYWADEAQRFIMIWMAFLAFPVLIHDRGHLVVDLVSTLFPKKWHRPMYLIGDVLLLGFLIFIFPFCLEMVGVNMISMSSAMRIPMGLVYICMPLGIGLCVLAQIQSLVRAIVDKHAYDALEMGGDLPPEV